MIVMIRYNHLILYFIVYGIFFLILLVSKYKRGYRLADERGIVSNKLQLSLMQIAGIILLGIVPAISGHVSMTQVILGNNSWTNVASVISILMVIASIYIAPWAAQQKFGRTPDATGRLFDHNFLVTYFSLRVLFLFSYECWFRGFLLTACRETWGIEAAIFINIALYALLHSVNGKSEMKGCVPLGILLCIMCIWAEAAWPAIVVHIAIAVSYEIRLVRIFNKPSTSIV
jgi:hypothetical protein